jgi:hypothetical protein
LFVSSTNTNIIPHAVVIDRIMILLQVLRNVLDERLWSDCPYPSWRCFHHDVRYCSHRHFRRRRYSWYSIRSPDGLSSGWLQSIPQLFCTGVDRRIVETLVVRLWIVWWLMIFNQWSLFVALVASSGTFSCPAQEASLEAFSTSCWAKSRQFPIIINSTFLLALPFDVWPYNQFNSTSYVEVL